LKKNGNRATERPSHLDAVTRILCKVAAWRFGRPSPRAAMGIFERLVEGRAVCPVPDIYSMRY